MDTTKLTQDKFSALAHNYLKQRRGYDKKIEDSMGNQTLKVIFGLLTNLSYAMFALAAGSTILNGQFEKYKTFFVSKVGSSLLFFIVILAILISILLRQIKEMNDIQAKTKKVYNCVADVMRTIFYILLLIFIAPLTIGNQEGQFWEVASFYIFGMAILLFIARKILKWIYFFGEGKEVLQPWKNNNINDQQGLKGIAQFLEYSMGELAKENSGNNPFQKIIDLRIKAKVANQINEAISKAQISGQTQGLPQKIVEKEKELRL